MLRSPLILICVIRSVFRSFLLGMAVEGHNYVEKYRDPRQHESVHVLTCETCGSVSTAWTPINDS